MNVKKLKLIFVFILIVTQNTWAESAVSLVKQGNKLYNQNNYNQAIKQYDQALLEEPGRLEPEFNKANCYYHLDDINQATELYKEVASKSKDMSLVAAAKYNLGNCYFQEGSKQKDSNLQKALEDLQTSITYWRASLDITADNQDAAKNIEVARLIIKDILDQINKQKQQQQQQAEKQKQLQQQLQQLRDQQKNLADQTQQTKQQADADQIDQKRASEDYNKQADTQSQLQQQTQQTAQQMQQQDPNNQNPQMQKAADELKQAQDNQSKAQEQLKASNGDAAKQSQDKAVEHLENAIKAMSQDNQQQQEHQGQQQQEQAQPQDQQNNSQDNQQQQQNQQSQQVNTAPDTTAQEILDKEQQQKQQRQMLQRTPYQSVEKDW